jgi:hypothetical protein
MVAFGPAKKVIVSIYLLAFVFLNLLLRVSQYFSAFGRWMPPSRPLQQPRSSKVGDIKNYLELLGLFKVFGFIIEYVTTFSRGLCFKGPLIRIRGFKLV